jgi:3',5'-cyclic AMP phosphodiesterase CpdA
MSLTFQTTGEPLTDLAILLRAARVQAAALRNEPDSHTRAFVRCLHDELTDQIDGLQDAKCDDADADAVRDEWTLACEMADLARGVAA